MSRREAELEKKIEGISIKFAQAVAALEKAEERSPFSKNNYMARKAIVPAKRCNHHGRALLQRGGRG